jgi:hypothetical protein
MRSAAMSSTPAPRAIGRGQPRRCPRSTSRRSLRDRLHDAARRHRSGWTGRVATAEVGARRGDLVGLEIPSRVVLVVGARVLAAEPSAKHPVRHADLGGELPLSHGPFPSMQAAAAAPSPCLGRTGFVKGPARQMSSSDITPTRHRRTAPARPTGCPSGATSLRRRGTRRPRAPCPTTRPTPPFGRGTPRTSRPSSTRL